MINFTTEKGTVRISSNVFTFLAGAAATNCFGVKGMAFRSMSDGLVHLLKKEAMGKGVLVTGNEDGSITINLHIVVDYGINIPAVASSIINEVKYKVQSAADVEVRSVNVFVDSIMLD